ncbi:MULTISPECIES: hypothetical protein [unclassified Streptomyces]|nr:MULTISPECIES: hypothetical protein [unclassified Streptomyces]
MAAEIHSASGPGFNVYACPGCAPYYVAYPERHIERSDVGGAE